MRVSVDNKIRIISFSYDNDNRSNATQILILNGFVKKSNKDYDKQRAHYDEAKSLLTSLGFSEKNKGKMSGSRVEFVKGKDSLLLHTPNPFGELKLYQVKQLIVTLKGLKLI